MKKIFAALLIITNIGAMLEPCSSHLREISPRSRRLLMLIAPVVTESSYSKDRISSQLLCPTSPVAKRMAQELKNSAARE